jgi:hypothetical protein
MCKHGQAGYVRATKAILRYLISFFMLTWLNCQLIVIDVISVTSLSGHQSGLILCWIVIN